LVTETSDEFQSPRRQFKLFNKLTGEVTKVKFEQIEPTVTTLDDRSLKIIWEKNNQMFKADILLNTGQIERTESGILDFFCTDFMYYSAPCGGIRNAIARVQGGPITIPAEDRLNYQDFFYQKTPLSSGFRDDTEIPVPQKNRQFLRVIRSPYVEYDLDTVGVFDPR